MEKEKFERIFGRLSESSMKLNLQPNQYSFKIDRRDGAFVGSVVNIDGIIYENNAAGDGVGQRIRARAQAANLEFVNAVESGLFK